MVAADRVAEVEGTLSHVEGEAGEWSAKEEEEGGGRVVGSEEEGVEEEEEEEEERGVREAVVVECLTELTCLI